MNEQRTDSTQSDQILGHTKNRSAHRCPVILSDMSRYEALKASQTLLALYQCTTPRVFKRSLDMKNYEKLTKGEMAWLRHIYFSAFGERMDQ